MGAIESCKCAFHLEVVEGRIMKRVECETGDEQQGFNNGGGGVSTANHRHYVSTESFV